jgi:uncharacterized membrane protein
LSFADRAKSLATFVAATALIAALVHFVTILTVPVFAEHDAFARFSALGPVDTTILLARPSPSERQLPFADPAVASAFCRYDLTNGPLRVRVVLGRPGFVSLSFHSRRGSVFYALADKAATHGFLEAVIVTPQQLRALAAKDDEEQPSQDLRVVSTTSEGFALIRALSELPSLYSAAEAQVQGLTCITEPLPKD